MAELTIATFLSLDGVIQSPGSPEEDTSADFAQGGWLVPYFDEDAGKRVDEFFESATAFLLGRTTYDLFEAYWSKVTDPDNPVAVKLNTLPKYVASRSQSEFGWGNTSPIRDVAQEVRDLKARLDGEIQVHGSGNLAQTLIEHDLVDEYRLFTFPVLVGEGKRLFATGTIPTALKLVRSSVTSTGVIVSVYRRDGEFKTDAFNEADEDGVVR
jgi:dihydrofolate reductase